MKKLNKKTSTKFFLCLILALTMLTSVLMLTACTGGGRIPTHSGRTPINNQAHRVVFLFNGGTVNNTHYSMQLFSRPNSGSRVDRVNANLIPTPTRPGFRLAGWYEVDSEYVFRGSHTRTTAFGRTVENDVYYISGHHFLAQRQTDFNSADPITIAGSIINYSVEESETDGQVTFENVLPPTHLFTSGRQWNFELDSINVNSYSPNETTDANSRTVLVAMWIATRQWIALPTFDAFRNIDPYSATLRQDLDALSGFGNTEVIETRNMQADGIVRASFFNRNNASAFFRRSGHQILGFYLDKNLTQPIPFDNRGQFRPPDSFWPDYEVPPVFNEYGGLVSEGIPHERRGEPRMFVAYIRYVESRYAIVSDQRSLTNALSENRSIFLTASINLNGASLNFPATYNGQINGNGHTISNFVTRSGIPPVTTPGQVQTSTLHGAVFNNIGQSARIININFENVTHVISTTNQTSFLQRAPASMGTAPEGFTRLLAINPIIIGGEIDHQASLLDPTARTFIDIGNDVMFDFPLLVPFIFEEASLLGPFLPTYLDSPRQVNALAANIQSGALVRGVNVSFRWVVETARAGVTILNTFERIREGNTADDFSRTPFIVESGTIRTRVNFDLPWYAQFSAGQIGVDFGGIEGVTRSNARFISDEYTDQSNGRAFDATVWSTFAGTGTEMDLPFVLANPLWAGIVVTAENLPYLETIFASSPPGFTIQGRTFYAWLNEDMEYFDPQNPTDFIGMTFNPKWV